MEDLGKKIVSVREAHNISQSGLARDLKISRSALYRYETGDRIPDIHFLANFAKMFKISLDSLIFGDEPAPNLSNKKATPKEIESGLLKVFAKHNLLDSDISDTKLKLIDQLITAVLNSDID